MSERSGNGEFDTHLDRQAGFHARRNAQRMRPAEPSDDLPGDDEDIAYGRVGARPLLMVRFCPSAGPGKSLAYAHLYAVAFDGQSELVLRFSDDVVTITGWGLGRLLDQLEQHRVHVVRVTAPAAVELREAAREEGVESIVIEPLAPVAGGRQTDRPVVTPHR